MKKLLILDTNAEFSAELAQLLRTDFDICGVTDDGEEGLKIAERETPAAMAVSLLLKNIDGLTMMEELKKRKIKTEAVALGNVSDDEMINRIMSAGAKYYFVKPVGANVVAERLKELVAQGGGEGKPVERKRMNSVEERISNIFISIGIPPHIKGYGYLREGIKLTVEKPYIINNVTKGLYPSIAKKFETTPSKVERAIRHAIEVAWNRGRIEAINAIFGTRIYLGTEKPTNSEFIALVADKLILENMI